MDKQIILDSHNVILLGNERNKQLLYTHNQDESQQSLSCVEEARHKQFHGYEVQEKQFFQGNRNQKVVNSYSGGDKTHNKQGQFFRMGEMFCMLFWMVITWCVYVKTYQNDT